MKKLVYLFLAFALACTTSPQKKVLKSGDLSPDKPEFASLQSEEVKIYKLELDSGCYVYGEVDQISVDVVVKIKDAESKEIASFDGPGEGIEAFTFETGKEGEYLIEVEPFKKETGDFSIVLKLVEPIAVVPEERIDQLMYAYTGDNVPGAAVGVIKNGKLVFSKAYGKANIAYNADFKTNTPTNIGSVTKQFTAMAVLLLEQQGKLSLDDDIRIHLPELPDWGEVIRIKNLLNHTNGLWEIFNLMPITGWKGPDILLRDEVIDIIQRQEELQAKPGEVYNYNNTAFILVAEIVKRLTDKELPEFIKENIFEPLEMNSSVVRSNPDEIIANSAMGYARNKKGYKEQGDLYSAYGAGGIYTTVEDLAKWMNNLGSAGWGGEELIRKLVTPDTLNNGDTMKYALGIAVRKEKGKLRYTHGGADLAHRANIAYFPEMKCGTIVLSNFAGFPIGKITSELNTRFLAEYFDEEKDEEKDGEEGHKISMELLNAYKGKYFLEVANMTFVIKIEDDKLIAEPSGQPKVNLNALNDSTFNVEGVDAKLVFQVNENKEVVHAALLQNGRHILNRIADYAPVPEELAVYEGVYMNKMLETIYTLSVKDSTLVAKHINLKTIELEPIEEDLFKGNVYFMSKLRFNRKDKGQVESFSVSNGRTQNIVFVKQ